jgi:hypothetical protein
MIRFMIGLLFFTATAHAALNDVDKQVIWGKNIATNGGFENGKAGWAATGGTFATVTSGTNLLNGKVSGTWNSDGAGQVLNETAIVIPKGLYGKNGVAMCRIQTPSGTSTHTFGVHDVSSALVTTTVISSTLPTYVFANFIFPSSGNVSIRFTSVASDEPLIAIDDCGVFDASEVNLTNISQASFIGSAYFATTANCTFTRTNTALGALSDSDCPGPTVEANPGPGTIQTTDANAPIVTVNNLPPGRYMVGFIGQNGTSATPTFAAAAISDGTTQSGQSGINIHTSVIAPFHIMGTFNYTTSGNRSFELFVSSSSNAVNINLTASDQRLNFYIYRYPLTSQQAYTTDQSDYGWTAYTPTFTGLGTVSTTSVFHKRIGDTLYVRGYTTCGTSTAVPPEIGLPGSLTLDTAKLTGDQKDILGSVFGPISGTVTGIPASTRGPYVITYDAADASTVTVSDLVDADDEIFRPMAAATTLCGSGQRVPFEFHVPISGWQNTGRAPQLVNSVVNPASGVTNICSGLITNSGTPTVTRSDGNCLSGPVDNGAGDTTLTIASGTFSSTPNCICTGYGATSRLCRISSATAISTTTVRVVTSQSSSDAASDIDFFIMCTGPK